MDLKAGAAQFKTPRKVKPSVTSNDSDKMIEIDSADSPLELFPKRSNTNKLVCFKKMISNQLGLTEDLKYEDALALWASHLVDDTDRLAQVVSMLLLNTADNDSIEQLQSALTLVEQDAKKTSAKVVELLSQVGNTTNQSNTCSAIQAELDKLAVSTSNFNPRVDEFEVKQQAKWDEF